MPSPSTSKLPKPRSWDEFEDIVADILRILWNDKYTKRYGRNGQKQDGVDIFGRPDHLGGQYAGAQCKLTEGLTLTTIESEVEAAKAFRPKLAELIFTTTMSRDAVLQDQVRNRSWPFRVEVMFWEDISLALSGNTDLLEKHFPGWVKKTTSEEQIQQLILTSEPSDFRYEASTGQFFLKSDTDLQIVVDRPDSGDTDRVFHEPWVKRFLDPEGYRNEVYIYYRDTRIMRLLFVSVDGGRYILPAPKSQNILTITPFQYHVGRIINSSPGHYNYEDGLRWVGFSVVDDSA